jgi:hypothetical protein
VISDATFTLGVSFIVGAIDDGTSAGIENYGSSNEIGTYTVFS